MSVIYYDTALKEKIKAVFNNTFFATTEEAFKECARINGGKVKLPLISVFRPMGFTVNTSRYNEHAFRIGYFAKKVKDHPKGKVTVMKELPVRLQYQIDIWAVRKSECDQLTEEMIMFLLYKPYIRFVNPAIELYKHNPEDSEKPLDKMIEAALQIEETIQDNSDIASFDSMGRFYRNTFEIFFNEPRIFSYNSFENFADEIPITYSYLDENEEIIDEDNVTYDPALDEEEDDGGEEDGL